MSMAHLGTTAIPSGRMCIVTDSIRKIPLQIIAFSCILVFT
jgi:hypothetical protein